ncbi:MAG: efflux RND transporter permease subunit, partial [bacterium]|nr:efflux RND transporter permease subunit [bacterium]
GGSDDRNSLRTIIDERIEPRLAAVPGVSRVMTFGGSPQEITVRVDTDRCAALGVMPNQITQTLARSVQRLRFLGGLEDSGRTSVILDGRPEGVVSLGETRVTPELPVLIRHVASVEQGVGREELLFRVNSKPSVGLVIFQEDNANLIRLGRALRQRIAELNADFAPYGIELTMGYDGAELVEEQLDRLKKLGLSGFGIALAVLLLFLRQWRAVSVVAIAVPVSLLAAVALLFLCGMSLNLITLFGLIVGIGMLVDNSIVVYEAVQRRLERGADPDRAAADGIRLTVRAILAATATNAVVFLPVMFVRFDSSLTREFLKVMAIAILLPLIASLLVAVGLVPLLARRLAAPAAIARLSRERQRRAARAGVARPDRARELFSGLLKVALRSPGGWLAGVTAAVLVTLVVGTAWLVVSAAGREPEEADEIRLYVEVPRGGSLESTGAVFARLEKAALNIEGVELVQSTIQEESGTLTVRLVDKGERPEGLGPARIRAAVRKAAASGNIQISTTPAAGGGGGGGGDPGAGNPLSAGPGEIVVSGPDANRLVRLAEEIKARVSSISDVGQVRVSSRRSQDEMHVIPEAARLAGFGLTADQVLPALMVLRREGIQMQTGFTQANGEEIPLTVRSSERAEERVNQALESLRISTPAGVLPLGAVATVRTMPPPPAILHHNGRRELTIYYYLGDSAPDSGPARNQLDEQIRSAVRAVHRPTGYTIDTSTGSSSTDWFKRVLLPVVLLLFGVLAITFESLTLPVLVLLALPLTLLGSTWALVLSGMAADQWAMVGAVVLLGLTINPAILLVDRMQERVRSGAWTAGAAALAAVRERARPVLMTTCTTLGGLWPLALTTGRENEIWPPFATVVMGGLATSTLLTLLVIPSGFVILRRLD